MIGSPHLTHSQMEMQTERGMAFFAGTGPEGKTCGDCKFRGYYRERLDGGASYHHSGCLMFKKLGSGRNGPTISKDNKSCKYFEPAK